MSKLSHSAEWVVMMSNGGYYPKLSQVGGPGVIVVAGLMYPAAHEKADELNARAGVVAPRYAPREVLN